MKTILAPIAISLFLLITGCDLIGGGTSGTVSSAVKYAPVNLTKTAAGYDYMISAAIQDYPVTDIETLARIGTTNNAACMIIWDTAAGYSGHCVGVPAYAGECTTATDGTVACPTGGGTLRGMIVDLFGPARQLTAEETALIDGLAQATVCNAPRADGSVSPCV